MRGRTDGGKSFSRVCEFGCDTVAPNVITQSELDFALIDDANAPLNCAYKSGFRDDGCTEDELCVRGALFSIELT